MCVLLVDYYDETDAVTDQPAVSAGAEVTETDNPELVPSYGDFLIAYPTQNCELNIDCTSVFFVLHCLYMIL